MTSPSGKSPGASAPPYYVPCAGPGCTRWTKRVGLCWACVGAPGGLPTRPGPGEPDWLPPAGKPPGEILFLAIYTIIGDVGIANVGTVRAANAEDALAGARKLFEVRPEVQGAVQIMPVAGLVADWSYYR